ncbi:hypothetical protein CYMTET_36193, partial [Cymbomonas tetramitiformis]
MLGPVSFTGHLHKRTPKQLALQRASRGSDWRCVQTPGTWRWLEELGARGSGWRCVQGFVHVALIGECVQGAGSVHDGAGGGVQGSVHVALVGGLDCTAVALVGGACRSSAVHVALVGGVRAGLRARGSGWGAVHVALIGGACKDGCTWRWLE